MRKIKFKAWDKINKRMFKPEKIHYSDVDLDTNEKVEKVYVWRKPYEGENVNWGAHAFDKDKEVILMQYTGLKDKNSKEIYEGDIVTKEFLFTKGDPFTGMVKYDDGTYWIDNGKNAIPLFSEVDILEVVGNIYENADLMEG